MKEIKLLFRNVGNESSDRQQFGLTFQSKMEEIGQSLGLKTIPSCWAAETSSESQQGRAVQQPIISFFTINVRVKTTRQTIIYCCQPSFFSSLETSGHFAFYGPLMEAL